MVGKTDEDGCRWTQPLLMDLVIENAGEQGVHGHIWIDTGHGFHPYEYQFGPMPDLSGVNDNLLTEFADYLRDHRLRNLIALEILIRPLSTVYEIPLDGPFGTFTAERSRIQGCNPTRQTGWRIEEVDGKPRTTCASYHAPHSTGHQDIPPPTPPSSDLNEIATVKALLESRDTLRGAT